MIEYMSWVKEMFPSISPYTHQMALSSVNDFIKNHGSINYITPAPLPFLAQGDVINNLVFCYMSDNGEFVEINSPGMLLSNTCNADIDNGDNTILFAPLIPLSAYEEGGFNKDTIIRNRYTGLLYFFEPPLKDYVVDLTIITAYSRKLTLKAIDCEKFVKICSLSLKGYYFFLSKLTVHLMRPESCDVERTA